MKVLMFGWEFPPHISGGLGTACYGLTKGLTELNNIEISFVVPKAYGDENPSSMQLIGANQVPISKKKIQFEDTRKKINYFEVESGLIPYVGEEEFWKLKQNKYSKELRFIETDNDYRIDFSGEYGPGLMDEIWKYAMVSEIIAKNNEFDIIHAHDWLAYPAGMAAKKISGKPLVVHVHATDFDRSGGSVNPRVYAIEREGMEAADKIIAVSKLTKSTIIEKYGIPEEKVTVVYNAVEPVFDEESTFPGKGINDKVVTFLGRITLQKGPEYFIEAAKLVLKKMDNVRFVMAGSGDLMNSMVKRVAELGISEHFHFTGFLKGSDVAQMLQLTDVFVMPSVSEPFGIVPLEAMQSKVPVVISKQSGVAEILKNTIKIDFWDTYAMADAIYALLNYNALSEHFKEQGKNEVDNLKWINSAKRVTNVYIDVLTKK
ncbi:MAG: glycosyltransferase family 4 protein [Prolixibacteraceae bacterium]|nr:glycosyltransferase family 4 protein [Prolixibacteraceae bacterium]